ncbi:MAG: hypothetical protein LBU45_04825 [Azoarcus sp.]|nr:hypothetical protein [Azoarcus sp.]
MEKEFVLPEFTGSRFNEHTLPVDVARDLAAYEALLIDLAKHLYFQDFPGRQRIPKGFSDFNLGIERIEEGSAVPVLALIATMGTVSLPGIDPNPYFGKARDLIAECIATPNDMALPEAFPKKLLSHFNQIGRSLREGEALELKRNDATKAVLNPERRKRLVLAVSQVYEREVDLCGSIGAADWKKSTFRLEQEDGSAVIVPMPESFHEKAGESGGRKRDYVFVKGVATYDSWERLQRVISTDSLEVIRNYPIVTRFDELAALEDGWYDGEGLAPDKENLATIAEYLTGAYPEDLPLPAIVPTPEGDLLLEWRTQGYPTVDLQLKTPLSASFHAFDPNNDDVEQDFSLKTGQDWAQFLAFLREHIRSEGV